MGFLDSLESMASTAMEQSGNPEAKVAGGLMAALDEHPGGLAAVIGAMAQNGVDPQAVAAGGAATTEQVSQGLAGTGLIEKVAEKAGVSPEIAQMVLTTVLPIVLAHFKGEEGAAPSGGFAGMASQILGKFF